MTIRVMHIGLGPIGAAVARQVASRKGFQIVGAVDIDPHKVGKDVGDVIELGRRLRVKVTDGHRQDDQGDQARRRGALHQLVAQGRDAAVRGGAEAARADRHHDGGGGVPGAAQPAAGQAARRGGAQGEGGGARHRRQPGLHDGRAADCAHRGVRAGRPRRGAPRAGRARPAAAVPAEDRRRPHAGAVPAQGRRRAPCATSGSPSRFR